MLNGDILEYHAGEVTAVDEGIAGGIDPAAIELLIEFVNFVWTNYHFNNLRLSGGFDNIVRAIGPQGVDWVARTFFTKRYRKAKQATLDAQIRSTHAKSLAKSQARANRRALKKAYNVKAMRAHIYTGMRFKTPPPGEYPWRPVLKNKNMPLRTRTDTSLTTNMSISPKYDGFGMLNFKNQLTKKLTTECMYEMSPILKRKDNGTPWGYTHYTGVGQGPHLYSTYQSTPLIEGGERFSGWNWPFTIDSGTDETVSSGNNQIKGVGMSHTVYVFAADYPFTTMNTDPKTQDATTASKEKGRYLGWAYRNYYANTDNNRPLKFSDVIFNNDWTYLTHFYTTYYFDFYNISHMPYVVEILFFKFKADVDTMDYGKQVLAVTRKQEFFLEEYINNMTPAPEDISIVYRKRIYLKGMENLGTMNVYGSGPILVSAPNPTRENSVMWKYTVKHKYVIKRPIIKEYNRQLAEVDFFNKYYDRQRGIYCRMQAWTLEGNIVIPETTSAYNPTMNTSEDKSNADYDVQECTKIGFGVGCVLKKKSRYKLDENMYKQYQATS